MITIVTTPRPFTGHYEIIQRNAIRSWLALSPKCEIILIGNDEGTADIASEFGIKHVPDVACSESGLPLMNSFLEIAQNTGASDIIVWLSSDIILMNDFLPAIESITETSFLMSAQRWDLDVVEEIKFTNDDWEVQLRDRLKEYGNLHAPTSGDLLVFPRGFWTDVPPFIIGRAVHDNWLFYRTLSLGAPIIDATPVITIVHQNHGYSSVGWDWRKPEAIKHPEFLINLELAGGYKHAFTLQDATLVLTPKGLKRPRMTMQRIIRRVYTLQALHPRLSPIFGLMESILSRLR
ncbi:MAG: hypothetical protein FIB07_10065 [Candidatus Methanoperedens sp.]|nr:hypothetical protein [Candidatus Methanoperedens sp.]